MLALAFAAPASSAPYLSASQTGGFVGANTSLTVSASGRARTTTLGGKTRHFRLSTTRLHALKRDVRAADFPHLKSSYGPPNCSDAFEFDLSHGGHDVTIIQCNAKLPRGLAALLEDVSRLLP